MFLGRRAAEAVCAVGAAVAGAAALAFIVVGPSYSTASSSIGADGTVTETSGTASLLEVGLSPLAALVMLITALALLGVAIGGLRDARGEGRGGRRLLFVSTLVLFVITVAGAASIGAILLPASLLAAAASLLTLRQGDSATV